jgi:hypothetical protein
VVGFLDPTLHGSEYFPGRACAPPLDTIMSTLYVLGGRQNRRVFKNDKEWNQYQAALVLGIDAATGVVSKCFEYQTPPEAKAGKDSSVLFKSGTLVGDKLYVCTSTEVLVLQLPEFRVLNYVSLPCFNDLHHVARSSDGTLLAAVTGLDMVIRFNPQGELLEEWNVLGEEPPWVRFSRAIDYRKVESTKPHHSHPNFVFELDGQVWVTRMVQRDAVCLTDRRRKVDLSIEGPHDGLVRFGRMYFTLVDGQVLTANSDNLRVEQLVDLKTIENPNSLLGWCRGILPLTPSVCWVGFTRVRKTRFQENVLWVKRAWKEGMIEEPSHVSLYDLESRKRLQRVDVESAGMNVVFGVLSST